MATGTLITIGYISGYTRDIDRVEAWEHLKEVVSKLAADPMLWNGDASSIGYDHTTKHYMFQYSAEHGNPLRIIDDDQSIFIGCSGGGESRRLKELCAMWFTQLIMREMHSRQIPVSVSVT